MRPQTHSLQGFRSSVNSTVGFSPLTFSSSRTYLITLAPTPSETRMLVGPIAQGWTLNRPLIIVIEVDDDGTYLVSDDEFAVYGEGVNREEATHDYVVSLIEYFQLLESRAKQHVPTAVLFDRLRSVLSRTEPARTGVARLAV